MLLLEAGGINHSQSVIDPAKWPTNLGSKRDWNFQSEPEQSLNDRQLALSMGKGLGWGSAINVMVWARGHQSGWNYFMEQSGDPAWSYESTLEVYKRVEDWHGIDDPER